MCVYVRVYVCLRVRVFVGVPVGVDVCGSAYVSERVHLKYYKRSVEVRGSSCRVAPWRMSVCAEGSARGEVDARL